MNDTCVVGFDDISMASWPLINLTTWVQPLTEMVDLTVAMIKFQLEDSESLPVQHVLSGKMIVRGSTRHVG
jgi:DNA-binding LacI/PurR family transcriptional regulator